MGAAYPWVPGALLGLQGISVHSDQGIDETFLQVFIRHELAGVQETCKIPTGSNHLIAVMAKAFPKEHHNRPRSQVIYSKASRVRKVGAYGPGFFAVIQHLTRQGPSTGMYSNCTETPWLVLLPAKKKPSPSSVIKVCSH